MTTDYKRSGSADLSTDAIRVYGQIAAGQIPAGSDKQFVDELAVWGFITFDSEHGGRPVALPPGEVSRRRLEAMLEEATDRVARMAALPVMAEQLTAQYERAQWSAGRGSEYIDDPAVVNTRLNDVVGSAEWEILAAQPGPRRRAVLATGLHRDSAALDRGVALRTLYRPTVRSNGLAAEYVRALSTRAGKRAEYRTLAEPFERAIIVDRRIAVISNHLVDEAPEHAAWVITDRAMVAYIAVEFESKWRRADPWIGDLCSRGGEGLGEAVSGAGGVRTTRLQREIMRDAVSGQRQRVTAQRLGISLRKLSAELAVLRAKAGVATPTELGFWWAQSVDRLVDDSAPAGEPTGAQNDEAAA